MFIKSFKNGFYHCNRQFGIIKCERFLQKIPRRYEKSIVKITDPLICVCVFVYVHIFYK